MKINLSSRYRLYFALFLTLVSVFGWGQIATLELGTTSYASNTTGAATFTSKDPNISVHPSLSLTSLQQGQAGGLGYLSSKNWQGASINTSNYWQFTVSAASGYQLSVSSITWKGTISGSGPTNVAIRSSVDNYASNIATATASGSITFSSLGITNQSTVTFRIYGWGASAAGGTWRCGDGVASSPDITVSGSVTAVCTTTTPSSLTKSSITQNTATIGWTSGNASYTNTLEVYSDSGYTSLVGSYNCGTSNSFNLTSLSPSTTYYIRVKSNDGTCDSSYLNGNFTTACTTPSAPSSPSFPAANVTATALTLNFTAPTTAPSGYTIFRSTVDAQPTGITNGNTYSGTYNDGTNTYTVITSTTVNGSTVTATDSVLTANTNYYYFIYSNNTGCTSAPYYSTYLRATQKTAPATPIGTITSTNCGSAVFSYTYGAGEPVSGVTYYWQSTSTGTSTANPVTSSYTITGTGSRTAYVNASSDGIVFSSAKSSAVTIITLVSSTDPSTSNKVYCQGDTVAQLSITASGTGPFTYNWYKTGDTSTSLGNGSTFTPSLIGTASYYCVVANSCGSYTTNNSGIYTINAKPSNPLGSISGTSPTCNSTSLSYSGTDAANCYWQTSANGIDTTNKADSSLNVTTSGNYYVRAYNGSCWSTSSTSAYAVTIYTSKPTITNQPTSQTVGVGSTATFSVVASNFISYQWQISTDCGATWSNISGATSASYTTAATVIGDNGNKYKVIITNPCGTLTSNVVNLVVNSTSNCIDNDDINTTTGWANQSYLSTVPALTVNTTYGSWKIYNTNVTVGANNRLQMKTTDAYAQLPTLSYPMTLNIYAQLSSTGSGTANKIKIQYSADGGSTFIDLPNSTTTIYGSNGTNLLTFDLSSISTSATYLRICDVETNYTVYIDKVLVVCSQPSTTSQDYTWTGASSTSWTDACNWTSPNGKGVPTSNDNVTFNSSTPTLSNLLNLTDARTVKNFTLNGTGNLNIASTGSLTVAGNVTYDGSSGAGSASNLDCASTFKILSTSPQLVPPLKYGNLDITGGNRTLSSTGTIQICSAFSVDNSKTYTITGSTVEYISPDINWVLSSFTYNNLKVSSQNGTGDFSIGYSSAAADNTITVQGDYTQNAGTVYLGDTTANNATLNINGNMNILGGTFELNNTGGQVTKSYIVNLKGNLNIASGATLKSTTAPTSGASKVSLTGSNNSNPQTISIANNTLTSGNVEVATTSGAEAKIINQDISTSSGTVSVVSNGILNFNNFNITGAGTFTQTGTGELKITSANGVNLSPTATGNVQTTTRNYSGTGIFHYIGATNPQATGDAFKNTGTASALNIIIDKDNTTDVVNLSATTKTTGTLNIIKGIFQESEAANIAGTSGNLTMAANTAYKTSVTSIATPALTGTYNLASGSLVELNAAGNQTLNSSKNYKDLQFSFSGIKTITSAVAVENIKIKNDAVVNAQNNTFGGSTTNLTMTDNAKFRMSAARTQPDAQGTYNLGANTTISFENTNSTEQSIYTTPIYANIDIAGSNVASGLSIPVQLTGKFTIKDGSTFKVFNNKGFSGATNTAISSNNNPTIVLENTSVGSTVDYARKEQPTPVGTIGDQNVTAASYANLAFSGNGIKTISTDVVAANKVTVNSRPTTGVGSTGAEVNLSVKTNYALTASKGITVNSPATATFENDANLLQDDGATNSGNITVLRQMKLRSSSRLEYNFFSSPVTTQNLKNIYVGDASSTAVSSNAPSALYYNEGNDKFYASTGANIPGRGLAIKEPNTSAVPASNTTTNLTFVGVPYTSPASPDFLTFSLAYTTGGNNLLGNPFPSFVDLDLLYDSSTNISPTFSFWDNTVNSTYVQYGTSYNGYSYATYNAKAGNLTGTGVRANGNDPGDNGNSNGTPTNAGTQKPTRILKIGQGFIARATGPGAKVVFKSAVRQMADRSGGVFFSGRQKNISEDRYWFSVTTPGKIVITNAIVYFQAGKNGYGIEDSDAPKTASDLLYTTADDKKVLINGRSAFADTDVVPVGVNAFSDGDYTIAIREKEGIFDGTQDIYLRDKVTGTITNLSKGSYTFAATKGEIINRFEIIYTPQSSMGVVEKSASQLVVYNDVNSFVLKSNTNNKMMKIQLYDMGGKLVKNFIPNTRDFVINNTEMPEGVYIVKVKLSDNTVISKKIRK